MAIKTYAGGYIPIEELEEETYTGGYIPITTKKEEKKYTPLVVPTKLPQVQTSRQNAILDLMKQGVIDPDTILNYLNYDEQGNKVGDFTPKEIKALQPKTTKILDDTISKAEELTGLKLKDRDISYSLIEMGKQDKGTPLGQQNKNIIVINSSDIDTPAGETSESSLIHELMHTILSQGGEDKTRTREENEAIVKDAEYYYLSGGKGLAPSFKSLAEEGFLKSYKEMATKQGLSLDPDDPKHFYDYRELYKETGKLEPDKTGHFPSKYKLKGHPRTIVEGMNTVTGEKYTGGYEPITEETPLLKPLKIEKGEQVFLPAYSGGYEPIVEPPKTYEIEAGKYPFIVPTSDEVEIYEDQAFPNTYVKGMWQDEAKRLEQLPKTQYTPINVDGREYKGIVKNIAFNYLQRGEFAVANALDAILKGDANVTKAVIDGFTGKQKRDFTDIALGLGLEGFEAVAVGMVAGVTLDPINYLPFAALYKGLSKTIGKTKALLFIDETSVATFLRRAFTAEEGAPKALHKLIKNLKKNKRYEETLVFEEIEKLSRMMKEPKNAKLITKVRELRAPMESLTTLERGVLRRIDEGYKHIGNMGVKVGILDPKFLKENYTHYYFEGLTKTATNIKNGHAGAPAFAKMRHIDNIIDCDNARTALIEGVQKALKGKNVDEARRLIETFPMAKTGSTLVGDASTYTARQILAKAKSVPKPGLNAIENYGYRKLEHIGAMYRQKVINTVVDPKMPYARPISEMTSRTARPGHELYMVRYRIPDINLKESDEVGKALYKQLMRTADSDIIQIEPRLAQQIQQSPFMQKFFKGKGPRIFEMRKEIADYMNETSQLFQVGNPTLEAILKGATKIQNMWKPLATIARPFWHVRNITFNQMQLFLSGVSPLDLVGRAIQANKVQRGVKGFLLTDNFGKVNLQKLSKESRKLGLFGAGFAGGDIATAKLITAKMKSALRGGKITLGDIVGLPKKAALKSAEFFEDNAHLVGWLDYIAKSKDPDLGTAMVKGAEHTFKFIFDYGDLSKFEKGFMKLADPFYAWHRKALGLYAEELIRQPGKFSNLGKLRRAFGKITPETKEEIALKPDWMEEQGYIKSPSFITKLMGGKQTYFYLAMPPDDLQMLSSMKDLWGAVTPYKTIVELLYGVKAFPEFGMKIEGYTPAPAWMTFLPEKTWKLLKLRPGRHIDYSTGKSTDVLQIPKSYLYAIETAIPVIRDIHTRFPQLIELAQEKATVKTWSQATGMGLVNENLNQWRNTIVFEIGELQGELTRNARKFEGIKFNGNIYNYVNETAEGRELQREIKRLSEKLRY